MGHPFQGENEHIIKYIRSIMAQTKADCYVFGHRHIETDMFLEDNVKYINTGVWFRQSPYAELSDGEINLKYFQG